MAERLARVGSRTWPPDFEARRDGFACGKCAEGRPDDDGYGLRIHAGTLSDAYLQRSSLLPGWTTVIWRGRHVAEAMDLNPREAASYWLEVLKVANELRGYFRPIKVNLAISGNGDPHLHTHVTLRFDDDAWPGQPIVVGQHGNCYATHREYQNHVDALRRIFEIARPAGE